MTDTSMLDPSGETSGGIGFFAPMTVGNPDAARAYLQRHNQNARAVADQYESVMKQRQTMVDKANAVLSDAINTLKERRAGNYGAGSINLPLLAMAAGFFKPTATHSFGEELGNALQGFGGALQRQRMNEDEYNTQLAKLTMGQAQLSDIPLRDKAALLRAQELQEEGAARAIEQAQIRTRPQMVKPIPDGMGGFLLPDGNGGFSHLDPDTGKITPILRRGPNGGFLPPEASPSAPDARVSGPSMTAPADQGQGAGTTPADAVREKAIQTLPEFMRPTDANDTRDYTKLAQLYGDNPTLARELWSFSQGLTSPDEMVSMRQNRRERLLRQITEFDPQWTPTQGKLRSKVLQDMAPAGTIGKNIISNNTLMEHSGILLDDMRKMHETGSPLINRPLNWLRANALGNKTVSDFYNQQQIVATELARQLKGGEPSQAEIEHQLEILNANSSPDQMQGYLEHVIEDADARKRQVLDQAAKVLGRNAALMPDHRNAQAEAARMKVFSDPIAGSGSYTRQQAALKKYGVPAQALDMLRSNPSLRAQFDAKYGPGASRAILGF